MKTALDFSAFAGQEYVDSTRQAKHTRLQIVNKEAGFGVFLPADQASSAEIDTSQKIFKPFSFKPKNKNPRTGRWDDVKGFLVHPARILIIQETPLLMETKRGGSDYRFFGVYDEKIAKSPQWSGKISFLESCWFCLSIKTTSLFTEIRLS